MRPGWRPFPPTRTITHKFSWARFTVCPKDTVTLKRNLMTYLETSLNDLTKVIYNFLIKKKKRTQLLREFLHCKKSATSLTNKALIIFEETRGNNALHLFSSFEWITRALFLKSKLYVVISLRTTHLRLNVKSFGWPYVAEVSHLAPGLPWSNHITAMQESNQIQGQT